MRGSSHHTMSACGTGVCLLQSSMIMRSFCEQDSLIILLLGALYGEFAVLHRVDIRTVEPITATSQQPG